MPHHNAHAIHSLDPVFFLGAGAHLRSVLHHVRDAHEVQHGAHVALEAADHSLMHLVAPCPARIRSPVSLCLRWSRSGPVLAKQDTPCASACAPILTWGLLPVTCALHAQRHAVAQLRVKADCFKVHLRLTVMVFRVRAQGVGSVAVRTASWCRTGAGRCARARAWGPAPAAAWPSAAPGTPGSSAGSNCQLRRLLLENP